MRLRKVQKKKRDPERIKSAELERGSDRIKVIRSDRRDGKRRSFDSRVPLAACAYKGGVGKKGCNDAWDGVPKEASHTKLSKKKKQSQKKQRAYFASYQGGGDGIRRNAAPYQEHLLIVRRSAQDLMGTHSGESVSWRDKSCQEKS